MSDQANPGGGSGADKPAGTGSTANAPAIDVAAIAAQVAEALKAQVSQEITGAVKRQTASLAEQLAALKPQGNADAPKDGDDKGKKLSPAEVQLAEVKKQLDSLSKESQTYKARALRGGVAEAVTKAGVTPEAAELLTDKFAGMVVEDDSGKLHVKQGEDSKPFSDYLAEYLKDRKGLLKSQAREGSGAGSAQGWAGTMPKTQGEVMFMFGKDAKGRPTRTPRSGGYDAFIAQYGKAAFDALPKA